MLNGSVFSALVEIGIIPVIRTETAEGAIEAIDAIYRGGIGAAEITMTVPGAVRALERAADRFGDSLVLGAGTVLDPETARICILAGAQFLVTPSLNRATIEMARRYSTPIMPGALTPTEVLSAWEAGGDAIKVFPCSAVGGAKYIKALRGPFPYIEMVPTGGVNLETTADFLRAGCCAVGVGGELIDAATVRAGRYEVLEQRARQFREIVVNTRAAMRK